MVELPSVLEQMLALWNGDDIDPRAVYAYGCIEHAIAGALKRETSRQIECVSLSLLCPSPHHLTARSFTAGAREAERGSPLFSRGAGNSFGWPRSSALRR